MTRYPHAREIDMSKTILAQVEARTQARHFTYALLRKLALLHNDRYGYAYPSLDYLARDLRASVRTVQRHLAKLERMGELIVQRVRGRGLNNRYFLKLVGIEPPAPRKGDRWGRLRRIFTGEKVTPLTDYSTKEKERTDQPRALPDMTTGLWPTYTDPPRREVAQRWLRNPAAWLGLGEAPA
jgi:DNA-binding transcriptional MocR family regulator